MGGGKRNGLGMEKLSMTTRAGMTTDEFAKIVEDWTASARHPKFDPLYTEVIYLPM